MRVGHRVSRQRVSVLATLSVFWLPGATALAQTRQTTRVSVDEAGVESDRVSSGGSVSADGRYVSFFSEAPGLLRASCRPGLPCDIDTNGRRDAFVKDRLTGRVIRASIATPNADGTFTEGNDDSGSPTAVHSPVISADGRYVVFDSFATNLVGAGQDTNNTTDIFLHDTVTRVTTRVSAAADGAQLNGRSELPALSADGRYITFWTGATNVVPNVSTPFHVYRKDRVTGAVVLIDQNDAGVTGNGTQAGGARSAMSAGGRYVVFDSVAANLDSRYTDANGANDIFVRDVDARKTVRVSVATNGTQTGFPLDTNSLVGLLYAFRPSISGDGRFVSFTVVGSASLAAEDTNGRNDVYVRDRDADGNGIFDEITDGAEATTVRTFRVSVSTDGAQGDGNADRSALSFDGRFIAFASFASTMVGAGQDTNGTQDIFVRDLDTDGNGVVDESGKVATSRVSAATDGTPGSGFSDFPSLSADGRFVTFESAAANLVSGDNNGSADIFILDRLATTVTTLASGINPALSGDGRYLAVETADASVVTGDTNGASDVFVRDRVANTIVRVSVATAGAQGNGGSFRPAISRTGRYVAFESDATNLVAGDTNAVRDIFLRDRDADGNGTFDETGGVTTMLMSATIDGSFGRGVSVSPAISADGRYIAFASDAANLVFGDTNGLRDIFVRDRTAGQITRVNLNSSGAQTTGGPSDRPAPSGDGRYVAFWSEAANLVANDTNGSRDVFVRDRAAATTARVSLNTDGSQASGASDAPSITEDGALVAFQSTAAMVPEDTNGAADVYLRPRAGGGTTRMSVSTGGAPANGGSSTPVISGDGTIVAFTSSATNLVTGDTNALDDVFVMDRATGRLRRASVIADRQGDGRSFDASLSGDGRTIAFSTEADNLQGLAAELLRTALRWPDAAPPVVIVQAPPPSISSVTPSRGPGTGGTVVEIRGQSLAGITGVRFGGKAAATFTVITPASLTVSSPAREAGTVDVQIIGQAASTILPGAFTYDASAPCTLALAAPATLAKTAGTTSLTVTTQTGCTWSATTPVDWIAIQGAGAGTGSGSFQIDVVENSNPAPRSGTVIVNEATVTINQDGAGCTYAVGPSTLRREVAASGGTDDGVTVTTGPGCAWTASADVPWLRPPAGGRGSAAVLYDIDLNSTAFDRTGTLTVQGTAIRVTQLAPAAPATCSYSFAPPSGTVLPAGDIVAVTVIVAGPATGCPWTARSDVDWITLTGTRTGMGTGPLNFTVASNAGGDRTGTIDVAGTKFAVTELGPAGMNPFGFVDTPTDGQSNITGSLAIAGWALDDNEVVAIDITRDGVAGEAAPSYYIGRATLVWGARPDIVTSYPGVPGNDRAGWGYLLLTNLLPNAGDGTYTLHITATDAAGNAVEIGTRTITCSNATATVPFGAMDTPGQGETISGSSYINFGWALTPLPKTVPKNGSTIAVYVDGVNLGSPAYDFFRSDVSNLFPGLNNSRGPVGFFQFDTRVLADRVHTIAWLVTDDAGAATGIGSRFFTVANGSTLRTAAMAAFPSWNDVALLPVHRAPLGVRRILGSPAGLSLTTPDATGTQVLALAPLDIVHVAVASAGDPVEGYALVNGRVEELPVGSTLDPATGTFAWQPGPGFKGTYDFVFVRVHEGIRERVMVRVTVDP